LRDLKTEEDGRESLVELLHLMLKAMDFEAERQRAIASR